MDLLARIAHFESRLPQFQAAAACIGVGPRLRRAGRFCVIVGAIAVLILLAHGVPLASPVFWAYLALLGFGIYLCLPDPQPWALPAAGLVIIAVLGESLLVEYLEWRQPHVTPHGNGIGVIIELLLALSLFGSYISYKRNLSATDPDTLAELRQVAFAMNSADLDQQTGIVELTRKNERLRLRRLDPYILLVVRHYIAFGIYSKLDAVSILKPEDVAIAIVGEAKAGRIVKIRISGPGIKNWVMKLKPNYLPRIAALGIVTTGLPTVEPTHPQAV